MWLTLNWIEIGLKVRFVTINERAEFISARFLAYAGSHRLIKRTGINTVSPLARFKAMLTPELIATVFYGLLSIVGGIIRYIKSQSKVSLISGGVSGLLLLILAGIMNAGNQRAVTVSAIIISLLIVVFVVRWFKTKKLIPAVPMIFFGGY